MIGLGVFLQKALVLPSACVTSLGGWFSYGRTEPMWHRAVSVTLSNPIPWWSFSVHHTTGSSVLSQLLPRSVTDGSPWLRDNYFSGEVVKGTKDIFKQCSEMFVAALPAVNISGLGVTRRESNKGGKVKQRTKSWTSTAFNKPLHILPGSCQYFSQLLSLPIPCSDFRELSFSFLPFGCEEHQTLILQVCWTALPTPAKQNCRNSLDTREDSNKGPWKFLCPSKLEENKHYWIPSYLSSSAAFRGVARGDLLSCNIKKKKKNWSKWNFFFLILK